MSRAEPTLFDDPPSGTERGLAPYQRGSDTSLAAAEKVTPGIAAMEAKVLDAYRAAGPRGLTPSECAATTGLDILSVRPRVTTLKKPSRRLLIETAERRTNGRGNREYVCVATEHAA